MIDSDKVLRGFAGAAVEATDSSVGQMMERRDFQSWPMALGKVAAGKALRPFVPREIQVDGENYGLIGRGGQQLVYTNGSEVAKLIYRSLSFDKQRSEQETARHANTYETGAAHMGEHLVSTEFDMRRFRSGLFATIAIQPYVRPKKHFESVNELISSQGDKMFLAELKDLSDRLWDLYTQAHIQLDLNGVGNVVLLGRPTSPRLTVVDTILVDAQSQKIVEPGGNLTLGESILSKMQAIRRAISEPRQWSESGDLSFH